MSEFILPAKLENNLPAQHPNNGYVDQIKNTISNCSSDISKVSNISANIKAQGGWDGFWNKGDNIRTLADNLVTVSSVQQRALDMVVLLIGAAGRMKTDYNVILESIEELSKSHSGSVDVLEYLVKIKNTVNEIKRRDELLDSLITYSNELRNSIEELNTYFLNEIKTILQSAEELNSKHKELSEGLSTTKVIIEKEQKFNRDKFTDLYIDIDQKNKFVLDTLKYVENSFQSKLDNISADQLKNITELNKVINQQIEDSVNNQKIINENLFNKTNKNFMLTIVSIIVLVLLIMAVIVFK